MSEKKRTSNLVDLPCGVLKHLVPFHLVLFHDCWLVSVLWLLLGLLLGCLDFVHGGYESVRE